MINVKSTLALAAFCIVVGGGGGGGREIEITHSINDAIVPYATVLYCCIMRVRTPAVRGTYLLKIKDSDPEFRGGLGK